MMMAEERRKFNLTFQFNVKLTKFHTPSLIVSSSSFLPAVLPVQVLETKQKIVRMANKSEVLSVSKQDFDFEITCKRFKNWLISKQNQNPNQHHDFNFEATCKRFKTWLVSKQKRNPREHDHDFDLEITCKRFKNWVSKQNLPTIIHDFNPKKAFHHLVLALVAAYSGAEYAHNIIYCICHDFGFAQPSPQSQFLSVCGGRYKPLLESFLLRGHHEAGNNIILMMACNTSISFLMNNIRGVKEDVHTCLVAGFGYGLMISLVRGVRGPSVLPTAAFFALLNAGFYKLSSRVYRISIS